MGENDPIVLEIALLDTCFADYQHVCIGTIESTNKWK